MASGCWFRACGAAETSHIIDLYKVFIISVVLADGCAVLRLGNRGEMERKKSMTEASETFVCLTDRRASSARPTPSFSGATDVARRIGEPCGSPTRPRFFLQAGAANGPAETAAAARTHTQTYIYGTMLLL